MVIIGVFIYLFVSQIAIQRSYALLKIMQQSFLKTAIQPIFPCVLNIHRRLANADVYCVVEVNAPLKKTIPIRRIFSQELVKMLFAWATIERN